MKTYKLGDKKLRREMPALTENRFNQQFYFSSYASLSLKIKKKDFVCALVVAMNKCAKCIYRGLNLPISVSQNKYYAHTRTRNVAFIFPSNKRGKNSSIIICIFLHRGTVSLCNVQHFTPKSLSSNGNINCDSRLLSKVRNGAYVIEKLEYAGAQKEKKKKRLKMQLSSKAKRSVWTKRKQQSSGSSRSYSRLNASAQCQHGFPATRLPSKYAKKKKKAKTE